MIYENSPAVNTSHMPTSNSPMSHFKSPADLTGVLKVMLLGLMVLMFINFNFAWSDSQYLQSVFNSMEYRSGQIVELNIPITGFRILITLFYGAGYLATGITFLMWVYRMNKNTHACGAADLSYTPGWAVGWFFIPLANLVMPCLVVQEIYRASRHPVQWKQVSCSLLVTAWWICWVVGALVGSPSKAHGDSAMLETMLSFQKFHMGAMVVFAAAMGLLYLVVTEISGLQNALFRYLSDNPDKHPSVAAAAQSQAPANNPLPASRVQTDTKPLYQHT
jgi:hypothetical protein